MKACILFCCLSSAFAQYSLRREGIIGENQHGDSQGNNSAGSRPRVLAADDEVCGEEPTKEQDDRSQRQPNGPRKYGVPPGTSLGLIRLGAQLHEPTATGASSLVAEDEGVPSLAARQVLHTRGRALRNDTLPLARQL